MIVFFGDKNVAFFYIHAHDRNVFQSIVPLKILYNRWSKIPNLGTNFVNCHTPKLFFIVLKNH